MKKKNWQERLQRMPLESAPKQFLHYQQTGRRDPGRQRERWLRVWRRNGPTQLLQMMTFRNTNASFVILDTFSSTHRWTVPRTPDCRGPVTCKDRVEAVGRWTRKDSRAPGNRCYSWPQTLRQSSGKEIKIATQWRSIYLVFPDFNKQSLWGAHKGYAENNYKLSKCVTLATSKLRTTLISLDIKWQIMSTFLSKARSFYYDHVHSKTNRKYMPPSRGVDLAHFRVIGGYNRLWNSVYLLFWKEPCDNEVKYSLPEIFKKFARRSWQYRASWLKR